MDTLFHLLFPAIVFIIAGVDRKKALMLAPVALIPDLDIFFSAHRLYLHSILPLLAIVAPLFLLSWKKRKYLPATALTAGYLFSHLVLDFFAGYLAFFWPITNMGYGLMISFTASQHSIVPTIQFAVHLRRELIPFPNIITDAALISPASTMLLFMLLVLLIIQIRALNFKK